jgi:16S rRNA (uracil1498-N3)-methyltransferase
MPRYDFTSPRVFVAADLGPGVSVALDGPQAHYLKNVLRLKPGDTVLAFNGRDGEWRTAAEMSGRSAVRLAVAEQTRPQPAAGDLQFLFAPLKRARLDYMVQKAVEMGASRIAPVFTRHSQAERVNLDRMRANAIEAAEQCGILSVPEVVEAAPLPRAMAGLGDARVLIFCDEDAPVSDPLTALAVQRTPGGAAPRLPLAVLIGPEGGFAEDERAMLLARDNVIRLALGPRILRADTAAVAALALVQAVLGDWR